MQLGLEDKIFSDLKNILDQYCISEDPSILILAAQMAETAEIFIGPYMLARRNRSLQDFEEYAERLAESFLEMENFKVKGNTNRIYAFIEAVSGSQSHALHSAVTPYVMLLVKS